MTTRALEVVLALAVLSPPAACTEPEPEPGHVRVLLTDATQPRVRAAVVQLTELTLEGDAPAVLRKTPFVVDLTTLAGDAATLVPDATVPGGSYSSLRVGIGGAYLEVANDDGTTQLFATRERAIVPPGRDVDGVLETVPANAIAAEARLIDGAITVDGGRRELVVHFDVSESFGYAADRCVVGYEEACRRWQLRPNLAALDAELTASVRVVVTAPSPSIASLAETLGLRAVVTPGDGSFRATRALQDANDDGRLEATFRYLDPRAAPFVVWLAATPGLVIEPSAPVAAAVGAGGTATVTFRIFADAATP